MANRPSTPYYRRATLGQIWRRLERLAMVFPPPNIPSRMDAIRKAAVQQLSDEDLDLLRLMIKSRRANLALNEREAQALAAYRSAIDKATRIIDR